MTHQSKLQEINSINPDDIESRGIRMLLIHIQSNSFNNMVNKIDNKNHDGISLREKLIELLKPSNLVKLVLVQQDELKRIVVNNGSFKPNHYAYIEQLYQHYIVNNKPKMYMS